MPVEIVIKIPNRIYKMAQSNHLNITDSEIVEKAIKEGVLLPEEHRKLIAEPTEEEIAKTIGGQNDFADCIRDAVKAVFDNAKPIIK